MGVDGRADIRGAGPDVPCPGSSKTGCGWTSSAAPTISSTRSTQIGSCLPPDVERLPPRRELPVIDGASERALCLPLWSGMGHGWIEPVAAEVIDAGRGKGSPMRIVQPP
jgi:hypothetical protein